MVTMVMSYGGRDAELSNLLLWQISNFLRYSERSSRSHAFKALSPAYAFTATAKYYVTIYCDLSRGSSAVFQIVVYLIIRSVTRITDSHMY